MWRICDSLDRFFKRLLRISFTISAQKIGIGNSASEYSVIVIVLCTIGKKFGYVKNLWKCFSPTHALPHIPFVALKFLNAICNP